MTEYKIAMETHLVFIIAKTKKQNLTTSFSIPRFFFFLCFLSMH